MLRTRFIHLSRVYILCTGVRLPTLNSHFNDPIRARELVSFSISINFTSLATAAMKHGHVLLVTFPVQGHINPAMQPIKWLVRFGIHVTLATTVYQYRRIFSKKSFDGFSVAAFSDGFDDGFNGNEMERKHYLSEMRRCGSESLTNLIATNVKEGRPFTYLVYTLLLPWAAEVARGFHIPAAVLWTQPATVLDLYYYYFHDHDDYIKNKIKQNQPSGGLELPGLPSLTVGDLPSFVSDSNMYSYLIFSFQEQLQALETNPRVLVNTFEALEPEALTAIDKLNMIAIGPLVPSALSDGKDPSDTSFGADLFDSSNDYNEWLDSKPESSVIYVSFGSISVLSKKQMEKIERALLDSDRPFLWVIREQDKKEEEEEKLCCPEELKEKGKIVKWCSQVEVLTHSSLGCFVTHCGWNSSLESLVCGVPVVAFPQWADQNTNAKLIQDVWKTGVRVEMDKEEGIVKSEEIRRCLDAVMGNEEMRSNAKKWKKLATEAVREGGSSERNLKAFVDEVEKISC